MLDSILLRKSGYQEQEETPEITPEQEKKINDLLNERMGKKQNG
jgi:Spy/CpxP family protein refolding chaperone